MTIISTHFQTCSGSLTELECYLRNFERTRLGERSLIRDAITDARKGNSLESYDPKASLYAGAVVALEHIWAAMYPLLNNKNEEVCLYQNNNPQCELALQQCSYQELQSQYNNHALKFSSEFVKESKMHNWMAYVLGSSYRLVLTEGIRTCAKKHPNFEHDENKGIIKLGDINLPMPMFAAGLNTGVLDTFAICRLVHNLNKDLSPSDRANASDRMIQQGMKFLRFAATFHMRFAQTFSLAADRYSTTYFKRVESDCGYNLGYTSDLISSINRHPVNDIDSMRIGCPSLLARGVMRSTVFDDQNETTLKIYNKFFKPLTA